MSWYVFNMNNILGLDTTELRMLLQQEGEAPYRGNQLAEWIYRHGARAFTSMSNLPNTLQTKLAQKYDVDRSKVLTLQQSQDGSSNYCLR